MRFVAEHLAFLLVLRKQVEKEKEVQEASNRTTRSSLSSKGVPKANDFKRAFRKLWEAYDKLLKLCVQAEREAENIVHCTPSLCLQLTRPRQQDHVPWAKFPKSESNCPVPECGHASMMPLQSRESINSGDDHLRRAGEANGGDGVFEPVEMKVGCYCYSQNCVEDKARIGCWWCVELAMERVIPSKRLSLASVILGAPSVGVLVKPHLRRVRGTRYRMRFEGMQRRRRSQSRRPSRKGRVVARSTMIMSRTSLIITPSENSSKPTLAPKMTLFRTSSPKHLSMHFTALCCSVIHM